MCEKSLFERYLDLVEDIIEVPVADFESELVEMLIKDFESLDSSIACYGYNKPYIVLEYKPNYDFSKVILNEIFENKIAPYDPQVSLLSKYFADHVSF